MNENTEETGKIEEKVKGEGNETRKPDWEKSRRTIWVVKWM